MTSLAEEAERWRVWATATAKQIHDTALGSDKLGGGAWDALLASAGVEPLPPSARAELAHKGPPRKSGPPPIEVRRALEAMVAEVARGCGVLEAEATRQDVDLDEQLDRVRREAEGMVEQGLRAYVAAVRPRVSTSSIFANAAATKKRHIDTGAGPSVKTETCRCCGAPVSSATKDRICVYCGTPL